MLWKFEILHNVCMGSFNTFATQNIFHQFFMANNWLVIKAKMLKIGN